MSTSVTVEELLDALEHLTGLIRDCMNVYGNKSAMWIIQQKSFDQAEKVIAKARGAR